MSFHARQLGRLAHHYILWARSAKIHRSSGESLSTDEVSGLPWHMRLSYLQNDHAWDHAWNARDGWTCYVAVMSKTPDRMIAGFTTGERDYIRRELDMVFSTLPSVAEGFQLKIWRGGPDAGKPKLSPVAKGLIARGLMRLDASGRFPRLFFTEAGVTALRVLMMDRRLADPKKFAHVRQELGIDPRPNDGTQPD